MDKNDLEKLDYGFTMAVNTLVTALGMHWENAERQLKDESPAYTEKQFEDLINANDCHHNGVIERWRN